MKKKIALEGAINQCTDAQAIDWRKNAISKLGDKYDFHNPMDFDCRGREDELKDELVMYDMTGMASSHIALVNWPKASIGTDTGMTLMWQWHRTLIVVFPGDNISPWLRLLTSHHTSRIFKTMDEAIDHLQKLA